MKREILLFLCLWIFASAATVVVAQNRVIHTGEKHHLHIPEQQALTSDKFELYRDSLPEFYSEKFGFGTLITNQVTFDNQLYDSLRIISADVLFYGGRSNDPIGGLVPADIQLAVWLPDTERDTLSIENADRVSEGITINIGSGLIGRYRFTFADTSVIEEVGAFKLGLYYEEVQDTALSRAVSPVFSPAPQLFTEEFQHLEQVTDSTFRRVFETHDQFWDEPENVGGIMGWLTLSTGEPIPTSVERDHAEIPSSISLTNFPNPFNPTTTIRAEVQQSGEYSITVSDVMGRMLEERTIYIEAANSYQWQWNGSGLGSGVYIITLTGDYTQTSTQMLLIK